MHGPTVKPALDFDASADAKHLHHVLSSHVSGKEEAVASLLCSRSNGQVGRAFRIKYMLVQFMRPAIAEDTFRKCVLASGNCTAVHGDNETQSRRRY